MNRLAGKVALVTGGGRGIGLSVVQRLAAEGARLVVNDLDTEPAEAAVKAVNGAGGEAIAYPGSVTEKNFAADFIDAALGRFGDIHIVVNNAGYIWNGPLHKISDAQWDAIQDVHLKAPFRILRALHGLTKSLAKEWGQLVVNVNCVAFGYIDTRLTQAISGETVVMIEGEARRVGLTRDMIEAIKTRIALGRAGTPHEAAGGVMLFCLPESDYVTGQVLEVDGGLAN